MQQQIPTKKGQIVKIFNPLADEDTNTLYMVYTDPTEYNRTDQITIIPLTELNKPFPFTDRIEINDLHVVSEDINHL